MSEKFTEGPWHVDFEMDAIYNDRANYICDRPLNNVHDAHLIAAAPEMYRAVEELVEYLDLQEGYEPYDSAMKLLAKARGES